PTLFRSAAFDFAVEEARRRDARLLVLASAPPREVSRAAHDVSDTRPLQERLRATGVDFDLRTVARRDDAADDILEAVESESAALVVLGIRRRTPIGKMLLGSTSQRVAIESPAPVVLVKSRTFKAPPRD